MVIPPSLMGKLGAQAWDEEYRRTGRVLFRPRRRALLSRPALIPWLLAIAPSIGTIGDWDSRGTWFYIRVAVVLFLLGSAAANAVRILRGRPLLRVDTTGIHLGKRFVEWSSIATIGRPVRNLWSDHLPIHLTDEDEDDVEIAREIIDDLPAFATWLTQLHNALSGRVSFVEADDQASLEGLGDPLE